ncbi:MAG TPA: type I glyceraldehyde-3-phosphate dehydrogenase [bacterium]|nr:type I glyceraldehyde-3-phosphate dehydrogenase [bacterium]
MIKIAINGFGRIGRLTFKNILERHPDLEVVAINDLTDTETLAYLLKYDSVYGIYDRSVKALQDALEVDGRKIKVFAKKDPQELPWKELDIDVVLECTGVFRDYEGSSKHLKAGAKRVVISAPAKSDNIPSYILGINSDKFDPEKDLICDMGSCTTNCLAPIVKVIQEQFGIVKGFMTTVHSYTSNQKLVDAPHKKDLRRGRSAAINIVPTTTGAAQAIGKVIPEVKGKLDGMAIRVPSPTVSLVDLVCEVEKKTSAEEVNLAFKKASQEERFKGILGIEDAPLVSCDYRGNSFSSIVDAQSTRVIDNMVKVLSWYDNEWGYAARFADFIEFIGKKIS